MNIINYGIGKKYLSHWGINEALREILQNFMDYGEYQIDIQNEKICISNNYAPENLEFLALGNSDKKEGSRGKYGEGLKMALLIFKRENIPVEINTLDKKLKPTFINSAVGEVFAISIEESISDKFSICFKLNLEIWKNYYNSIIKKEDILFDDKYYGKIVNKEKGNIYCGGLFVKKVNNLSKSYDINVSHLPLTRDRNLPQTFDVNWATSKINQSQGKLKITDLSYSDTSYVEEIPESIKKQIKPRLVGNSIEATYKHKEKDIVIKNDYVKNIVLKDNFFKKSIKKLRNYLLETVGAYDLLVQFRDKHIYNPIAIEEFNSILEKLKNN